MFISILSGQTIYTLLVPLNKPLSTVAEMGNGKVGPRQTCQLCTRRTLRASNRQLSLVVFTDWPTADHSDLMWITFTYISVSSSSSLHTHCLHSFPGAHLSYSEGRVRVNKTTRGRTISVFDWCRNPAGNHNYTVSNKGWWWGFDSESFSPHAHKDTSIYSNQVTHEWVITFC